MTRQTLERLALAAATIALAVFLVRGARVEGRAEFDRTMTLLDELSADDALLDAELLRLAYGLKINYDELTRLQTAMRRRLEELERAAHGPSFPRQEIEQKLLLSEDFKTEFAIHRNSVAIASSLVREAVERAGGSALRMDLYRLENAIWRFIAQSGDRPSDELAARLTELGGGGRAGAPAAEHWPYLANHVRTLLAKDPILDGLVASYFAVPLEDRIQELRAELRTGFEERLRTASSYSAGLFGLALALLGYGTRKAYLAHRYVGMLENTNERLEERVRERTRELEETNEALAKEMHERSEIEARLRLAQKLEAIGQLAAGVAHEINTPCQYVSDNLTFVEESWQTLGPLLSACQAAADGGGEPPGIGELWRDADADFLRDEVANAITESHEGMKQIRDTVRALKEFSHPDSQEMQLADVNRLIHNALMVARNEYKYVADVELDLADPPPAAPCFTSLINQVLLNLVVNSAHAIGEKVKADPSVRGRIKVSSRLENSHVVVSVADDGGGIPPEIRGKVFDPFFTTKEVGKGTGQGLAIAHRIIEQHNGEIELDSTPGVGTTFRIRLPLTHAAAPNAAELSVT